jgi:hypothetical protein
MRGVETDFKPRINGLWVMTPEAMQRTALEKDGRPDSRAIIKCMPFNVENQRPLFFHFLP